MQLGARFTSLILSMLLLGTTLRVSLVYTYYLVDRSDFIERLCENRDKPELKCDGKCYLGKMLKAQQDTRDAEPMPPVEWKEVQLWPPALIPWQPFGQRSFGHPYPEYLAGYTYQGSLSFFHPPPLQETTT